MFFKKWRPELKGIHIIQHFKLSEIESVGKQLDRIIRNKTILNPVVAIVSLTNRPKTDYSHEVKRTGRQNFDLIVAIKNMLTKYPMTEMVVLEGGQNIVLYSGQPFGSN